jgi:hypothetical protein
MGTIYSACPCGGFFRLPTMGDYIVGTIPCSKDSEHLYPLDDFERRTAVDEFVATVDQLELKQREADQL